MKIEKVELDWRPLSYLDGKFVLAFHMNQVNITLRLWKKKEVRVAHVMKWMSGERIITSTPTINFYELRDVDLQSGKKLMAKLQKMVLYLTPQAMYNQFKRPSAGTVSELYYIYRKT